MATGKKLLWAREVDSDAWQDALGVTAGATDLISVSGKSSKDNSGNKITVIDAVYNGAGAITLTNYNGFGVGSIIRDVQAFKLYLKTGATTWKTSAAFA